MRAELMLDVGCAEGLLGRCAALEHLQAAYAVAPDPVLRVQRLNSPGRQANS
jgi:hypothetical protein